MHQRSDWQALTEVEATPSQPPGGLAVVQSPIVGACEPPPPPDDWLLSPFEVVLPEFVVGEVLLWSVGTVPLPPPELVSPAGAVFVFEEPEGELPGCWHCQDGSGAQEPPSCCRHCAYAVAVVSIISTLRIALPNMWHWMRPLHLLSSLQIHSLPSAHGRGPLMPWLG